MPFYNVVLHASRNQPDGKPCGFYVSTFVWARDHVAAAARAKRRVRASHHFPELAARIGDVTPRLEVDSMARVTWHRWLRGKPDWEQYDGSQPGP